LENRVEGEALRRIANFGGTDAARAASLAVRRAKAAAKGGGAGGALFPPLDVRPPGQPGLERKVPPGHMPPARDGTIVKTGDSIMSIVNGKPVRIGSAKVLSVGPSGNLLLTTRGGTIDLGRPDKNGNFTTPDRRVVGFMRFGGALHARIGGLLVSLEDGSVREDRVKVRRDARGVMILEPPSRTGRGSMFVGP
jgi:hypothetical protein